MAAPRIGSVVKVLTYRNLRDYENRAEAVEIPAEILSPGPPGQVSWWAFANRKVVPPQGRYLLVRKIPGQVKEQFYALLDRTGE